MVACADFSRSQQPPWPPLPSGLWVERLLALLLLAGLFSLILAASANPVSATHAPPREYEAKARYLLNLASVMLWPDEQATAQTAPLMVCVLGRDPFGQDLTVLDGQRVRGRPFRSRRIETTRDTDGCHFVFVAASEEARVPQILRALAGQALVTVSDVDGFVLNGGAIGLFLQNELLVYELNLGAFDAAHVQLRAAAIRSAANREALQHEILNRDALRPHDANLHDVSRR